MPDAPEWLFDPKRRQREADARANSKPYREHPTVTVWEYMRMSRAEQEKVQRECGQIERAKRQAQQTASAGEPEEKRTE